MNTAVLSLIGSIVLEGVKLWSEERRTRFLDEYHEILTKLEDVKNSGDQYTNYDESILIAELEIFLKAYKSEIEAHNAKAA